MLILLSPAKTLDFETPVPTDKGDQPRFSADAARLIDVLKDKSLSDVRRLMALSPSLAALNVERYRSWRQRPNHAATRQALFAFRGDVYQGLDANSFTARDINWAERRIRILSGLYGVLRPLDRIQPYRLEMGTRLSTQRGSNLYEFWGDKLTRALAAELETARPKACINLASNEYFGAIDADALGARVISPRFLDQARNGDFRVLSFFAKRARGLMAAWLVRERVTTIAAIEAFAEDGYRLDAPRSTPDRPTFIRERR